MASPITIGGLGSGLDTRAIIDALMAVERLPIDQLQQKKQDEQDKINLLNTFRGKVDALRNKAYALGTSANFMAFSVTPSEQGVATFSAAGGALASTHTLTVNSLATTDRWAFDGVADPDARLATANGQSVDFTYDGQAYSVPVTTATSSLNEIASQINTVAGQAVSASVVNAGTSAIPNWQLVLTAKGTGKDFRVQGLASTIAGLTVDGTGPDVNGVAQSTNNISVGLNAVAVIDGLTVERTTNDFDDVLPGVSISLLEDDPSKTIQFTVEPNKTGIKSKLKEFVDAYNDVVKFVHDQNQYDTEKGAGGPLFGENVLDTIQRTVRNVMFGQSAAQVAGDTSGFGTPRLLGIESQADGTLKINDAVMDKKLDQDLTAFADLFADTDGFDNGGAAIGSPGYYTDITPDTGLGDDLARALDQMVKSYGSSTGQYYKGVFDSRVEALNSHIKSINDTIDQRERRLSSYEDQLTRKFSALESLMAQLQSQSSFLNAR